jgi:hypothetical protein
MTVMHKLENSPMQTSREVDTDIVRNFTGIPLPSANSVWTAGFPNTWIDPLAVPVRVKRDTDITPEPHHTYGQQSRNWFIREGSIILREVKPSQFVRLPLLRLRKFNREILK